MKPQLLSKEDTLRKRVYNFYFQNRDKGKTFTVNHFLAEKIPKRTIYSIIERLELGLGWQRKSGSGPKAVKMNKKHVKDLCKMFNNKCGLSQRRAARKYNCSQQYISKTLATKTKISNYKRTRIPLRTPEHIDDAKKKCGRLYRKFGNFYFVMDDESYFTKSNSVVTSNSIYYTTDKRTTPTNVKFYPKAKYEEKIGVYLCISAKGVSKPAFFKSGNAINRYKYMEFIKDRVIPFIKKHHKNDQVIFWPDKASSHYSNEVIDYMKSQNLNFVDKEDNPTNVPEARPVEDFWRDLKQAVYEKNWEASCLEQLKRRIEYCLGKMDLTIVQTQMERVKGRLDFIRRHGVVEARKNIK